MARVPDSPENPLAGTGAVMLDIGGDVGALIVTMPAATAGQEVEIAPVGSQAHEHEEHDHGQEHEHGHGHGHGHRLHVAVVRRPVAGGEIPSLVFPELVEGTYELFDKGEDQVRLTVEIVGGQVATSEWPG